MESMPSWLKELGPIAALLGVIAFVLWRLPKVELGHSEAFKRRRFFNWFPLGLTYAFLYMGRYNLTVSKNALGDLMSKDDFGWIFGVGAVVYGCAFVLNGPLTDRWGGRRTILIAAIGSAVMNIIMGSITYVVVNDHVALPGGLRTWFSVLYAANMYFQSFGAVSIVKVNAYWFHVRERGMIGGVFGILIALGVYFAFDWGRFIVEHAPTWWVFFVPAAALLIFALIDTALVRDSPSHAGFADFDTHDASSGQEARGPQTALQIARRMFTNPVILTIAAIEFCSGFLRNATMQWYPIFAKETGVDKTFVPDNWGLLLCMAGILGGVFAGAISDHAFQSRRGPVATILYAGMLAGVLLMVPTLGTPAFGWAVLLVSLCVIGVHGALAGTASMDFGGRHNAGVAVGLIDGCVYLGTAAQSLILGDLLPKGAAAKTAVAWSAWPWVLVPAALLGLTLATRVWNAKPQPKASGAAPSEDSPNVATGATAQMQPVVETRRVASAGRRR